MTATPSIVEVIAALREAERRGGSFMSSLASAGLLADPINRQRLIDAFPELLHYAIAE